MRSHLHTAIIGGGLAGLTTAWQLHRLGMPFTLYEASPRLGGTIRTVHRDGFIIELGPDGWVTEKPWARELAADLGLEAELLPSNDAHRVTHILRDGALQPMPDGMRMMVPTDLAALDRSPLFSPEAKRAYAAEPARAAELRRTAPDADESIASFVLRHFGNDVLWQVAGPLLSGVFGGSVCNLSVRAVMPQFVAMERTHGSLITALQARPPAARPQSIFTSLASGLETLITRMATELPPASIHLNTAIDSILPDGGGWLIPVGPNRYDSCDHLVLATPAYITSRLLLGQPDRIAHAEARLAQESSSAILVALAFDRHFPLPPGFGFLVPEGSGSPLLACTFTDAKYPHRVPAGKRLLRAFFGGLAALPLMASDDGALSTLALEELQKILGPLPTPAFSLVQRWPLSLPQYAVSHLDRTAALMASLPPDLHLVGNAYHGVGLPDIIREARALARRTASLVAPPVSS